MMDLGLRGLRRGGFNLIYSALMMNGETEGGGYASEGGCTSQVRQMEVPTDRQPGQDEQGGGY
jgi:hypothetical protein